VEVRGGSEESEKVKKGRGGGCADRELEELAACWREILKSQCPSMFTIRQL
jgi:hypothetical protein